MIIKSTSRKDANFQQIVAYLHKECAQMSPFLTKETKVFTYVHNMDIDPDCQKGMITAFRANDQYRKKRKNGVAFFHDILSFSPEDSAAIVQNSDMLRDLTEQYIRLRSPHAVVIARPHIEENHVHIHVIISASERESDKSVRISKAQLEQIKQQIRAYQLENYPELVHSYQPHQRTNEQMKTNIRTHATWQMEKRGGVQDQKTALKNLILEVLQKAETWIAITIQLKAHDIAIYKRGGRISGVLWKGKKYRFSTLIRNETNPKNRTQMDELIHQKMAAKTEATATKTNKVYGKEEQEPLKHTLKLQPLSADWKAIQEALEHMDKQQEQSRQFWEQQKDRGDDFGLEFPI